MRIIAGKAKGTRLVVPQGRTVRPTRDAVREALFSILDEELADRNILDLYAGTGSLGLEALSRGAEQACFVESDPVMVGAIEQNLKKARLSDRAQIYKGDVLAFLNQAQDGRLSTTFDLILCDPPFPFSSGSEMCKLTALMGEGPLWGNQDRIAVIEVDALKGPAPDLETLPGEHDWRKWGRNLVLIARWGR